MMDHQFLPSEADPSRCGVQLPNCAPWPAPPTQTCWGLADQHPDPALGRMVDAIFEDATEDDAS